MNLASHWTQSPEEISDFAKHNKYDNNNDE